MITRFLSWWLQQMLDLVPERFAPRRPERSNAIIAIPDRGEPGAVLLSVRRNGQEQPAGRHTARETTLPDLLQQNPGLPLVIRLPRERLLSRDISLPLASESGLAQVLHYEMDRLTPFAASDVFWSALPRRRNKEAGRLDVRLSLVPRASLADTLSLLQAAGCQPAAIEIESAGGLPPQRIEIAHEPGQQRLAQRRLLGIAAGACAALALVAIVLPFLLQSIASAAVSRRIEAMQPRLHEVEALRQRIRAATAGVDTIAAARARLGDPLALLAALTRVLPDDTYLTDLTLHDGVITLTGQSPGAVKLIPVLSADPAFVAPAFSAPVTRIESNNTDLFSIRAGVAGR